VINVFKTQKLTNPVSTFGVTIIFEPFIIPFSMSVPSCSSLMTESAPEKKQKEEQEA